MVGDSCDRLLEVSELLIRSKSYYSKHSKTKYLYGKGDASLKISKFINKNSV